MIYYVLLCIPKNIFCTLQGILLLLILSFLSHILTVFFSFLSQCFIDAKFPEIKIFSSVRCYPVGPLT